MKGIASFLFHPPSRLDTNLLGESIRGRLGRVYDAADFNRFRRSV